MPGRRRRETAAPADLPPSRPWRWLCLACGAGVVLTAWLSGAVAGVEPLDRPAGLTVQALRAAVVGGVPVALLLLALHAMWRHRLEILAARPGPIRVRSFVDRTGGSDAALTVETTAAFQRRLAKTRIYGSSAIPSSGRSSDFLRVVEEAGDVWPGFMGAFSRLVRLLAPSSCYELRCTLLPPTSRGKVEPPCGLLVELARLPGASVAPTIVRAETWDRAIEQAVHRVAAAILPRTRQCRTPPWTTWDGLRLPAELFDGYQRFHLLRADRRYDEAMAVLREATLQDPGNLALLLEMGKLQEQTEMYLDALFTYDNIIGRASRRNRELAEWWNGAGDPEGVWSDELRAPGLPPGHPVVEVARYRHAMLLARGDTLAEQWWRRAERCRSGVHQSARERRRDYLRRTLGPRLQARYARIARDLDETDTARTTVGEYLGPALPNVSDRARKSRALDARIFFTTVAVLEFERLVTERRSWWWRRRSTRADQDVLPRRALQLCLPYAGLRRSMALAHGRLQEPAHRTTSPTSASGSVLFPGASLFRGARSLMTDQWPASVDRLAPVVRTIMGDTRTRLRSWHEHYNAASAYAVLLLPADAYRPDGPQNLDASARVVRASVIELEKAVASADGGFVAAQQDWLLTEDPDLDQLRGRAEFREFEATTFGSVRRAAQRGPRLGLWEQSAYVSRFIHDAATQMAALWKAREPAGAERDELARWVDIEVEAWRLAEKLALDHRDWAARNEVAAIISSWEGLVDVRTPTRRHPRYSDGALGLQLASMRGQSEVRDLPRTEGRTVITVADEVRDAVVIADHRLETMAGALREDGGNGCCSRTAPQVLRAETEALRAEFAGPVRATRGTRATVVTVWSALSPQRWQALAAWFDDSMVGRGDVEARGAAFTELMCARSIGSGASR